MFASGGNIFPGKTATRIFTVQPISPKYSEFPTPTEIMMPENEPKTYGRSRGKHISLKDG